ncbi:glycosyl hydrolase family 28-related protein [Pedobacter sp. 22226]|uniref:glycosyl hydrolase family 28-related protein n=1 Tax=Pedobacter sp. 22226 TaxID=3453894 RepID=UPI003F82B46E
MKRIIFFILISFHFACRANVQIITNISGFVSLDDFGAIGDGKTDNYLSFQKAVDYCEKNGRKSLLIPFGNYYISKSIFFKRGGVQIIGTGALLREESWLSSTNQTYKVNNQDKGSIITVENNINGIVFDKDLADPIRITDVQFRVVKGRKQGTTTAVLFRSEFKGPTWPFIIERCRFTGFNFAVRFSSKNQYNVAFVQFRQNAFNQNDECVYFDDIEKTKSTGIRNLSWGFTFENNVCHDNSRIIRAGFAKDAVNIKDNNMEGNIPYSSGKKPKFIIDIEISNCTVNFEGNHFESTIADAVYISSIFKDKENNNLPYIGTTASGSSNKVFIKGNNFDGVDKKMFKTFCLKGLLVYNYDQVPLFVDECDIRINESNEKNIFLTPDAQRTGTAIKFQYNYFDILKKLEERKISIIKRIKNNNDYSVITSENFSNTLKSDFILNKKIDHEKFFCAIFNINNIEGTDFLGISTKFIITYDLNGKKITEEKSVRGNYGYKLGTSAHVAIVPNTFPSGSRNLTFNAMLEVNKDIIGNKKVKINKNFLLLASNENIFDLFL